MKHIEEVISKIKNTKKKCRLIRRNMFDSQRDDNSPKEKKGQENREIKE